MAIRKTTVVPLNKRATPTGNNSRPSSNHSGQPTTTPPPLSSVDSEPPAARPMSATARSIIDSIDAFDLFSKLGVDPSAEEDHHHVPAPLSSSSVAAQPYSTVRLVSSAKRKVSGISCSHGVGDDTPIPVDAPPMSDAVMAGGGGGGGAGGLDGWFHETVILQRPPSSSYFEAIAKCDEHERRIAAAAAASASNHHTPPAGLSSDVAASSSSSALVAAVRTWSPGFVSNALRLQKRLYYHDWRDGGRFDENAVEA